MTRLAIQYHASMRFPGRRKPTKNMINHNIYIFKRGIMIDKTMKIVNYNWTEMLVPIDSLEFNSFASNARLFPPFFPIQPYDKDFSSYAVRNSCITDYVNRMEEYRVFLISFLYRDIHWYGRNTKSKQTSGGIIFRIWVTATSKTEYFHLKDHHSPPSSSDKKIMAKRCLVLKNWMIEIHSFFTIIHFVSKDSLNFWACSNFIL